MFNFIKKHKICEKLQITNPKLQITNNLKIQIFKSKNNYSVLYFEFWSFEFMIALAIIPHIAGCQPSWQNLDIRI